MKITGDRRFRDFAVTALILVAFLCVIAGIFVNAIQALLPIAALSMALLIFIVSRDRDVRLVSGTLSFAFGMSTLSNFCWYLMPDYLAPSLGLTGLVNWYYYYYATGTFWLLGYIAVASVLVWMLHSRQWHLARKVSRTINVASLIGILLVAAYVFLNLNWQSKHLIDIIELMAFLWLDIIIVSTALKMALSLRSELRYLALSIIAFFGINSVGDLLFETRWLFGLSKLITVNLDRIELSFHLRDLIDVTYNVSLVFIAGTLFMFVLDHFARRTLDEVRGQLKDTQLFVDDLVAKSPDATCIFDCEGRIVLVNDALLHMFGLKRSDIDRSFNIFGYISARIFRDEAYAEILKVRDSGTVIIPKLKVKCIPGGRQEEFYLYLKMFPTYSSEGKVTNYVMIIEDITARIEMETALRQSEEKFRVLAETSPAAICLFRGDQFLYVNPAVERISGYSREEFATMKLWDLLTPEYRDLLQERMKARLGGAAVPSSYELRIITKSKELKWVSISMGPVDINNSPAFMVSAFDVTERMQAEKALRESEEKFRALAEMAPAAICILQNGGFKYANPAMVAISGYSRGELLRISFMDLIHPDIRDRIAKHYDEWARGTSPGEVRSVLKCLRKDGTSGWIDLSRNTIDYEGQPAMLLTGIDITDRKRVEEALRESENKYRNIVEQSSDGILISDERGVIVEFNAAQARITGQDPGDWMGRYLWDYIAEITAGRNGTPAQKESLRAAIMAACQRGYHSFLDREMEVSIRRPDGEIRSINMISFVTDMNHRKMFGSMVRDVTERKQAEKALQESEEKFRTVFEQAAVGMTWVGLEGRFLQVNQKFLDITGYTEDELTLLSISDITYAPDIPAEKELIGKLLRGEIDMFSREKRYVRKDGSLAWVSLWVSLIRENGRPKNFVGVTQDITERKQAEEALRESEEQYRNLVENVGEWIWENDLEGRFSYSSPKIYDLLGYRPDEVIGLRPHDLMTPESVERMREQITRQEEKGEYPQMLDVELLHKDGRTIFMEVCGKPVYDRLGNHTGFRGVSRDVTARKQAEEALRESEEKFRALADSSQTGILLIQGEEIAYINKAQVGMLGYTLEEIARMNYWDVAPPGMRDYLKERGNLRQQGFPGPSRNELMLLAKDGQPVWLDSTAAIITYRGKPAMLLTSIDITDRKHAEEALRASEASLAKAQAMAHIGSWEWDSASRTARWSDEMYRIFGFVNGDFKLSLDSILGRVDPADAARVRDSFENALKTGQPYAIDFLIARRDGSERTVHCEGEIAVDKAGRPVKVFGTCQDITERVRLENELRNAYDSLKAEYERKIDFTNAAAHELRTPLTPIIGYTDILKSEVKDERHRRFLDIIERNALRQKTLVNRMLELASLDAGMAHVHRSEFDLAPLATEIADNYRVINPYIRVEVPVNMKINTDPDILRHVLDNLVSNAIKYSDNDKEIVIRVIETGDSYQFSVKDQGAGIPKEEWGKIFERFYIVGGESDSRSSGRSGLGLALVKAYIRLIGGNVWLESEPGKGSTFFFTVPRKPAHRNQGR